MNVYLIGVSVRALGTAAFAWLARTACSYIRLADTIKTYVRLKDVGDENPYLH